MISIVYRVNVSSPSIANAFAHVNVFARDFENVFDRAYDHDFDFVRVSEAKPRTTLGIF